MSDLDRLRALLGEPSFPQSDPAAWTTLEHRLGVELPRDFRDFVDAYGPGQINTAIVIRHPSLGKRTLEQEIAELIETHEIDLAHCKSDYEIGTAPGQLLPFAVVLGGFSLLFLVGDRSGAGWRVSVFVPGEMVIVEFPWGFAPWLVRYLEGDERCRFLTGSWEAPQFSNKFAY